MNNLGTSLTLQKGLGQQTDDIVALDEPAIFIKEKTAIKVTIPGDPNVCLMFGNSAVVGVRFSSSIGFGTPFGKCPSRLMMHLDEFKRQMRLQKVNGRASTAIACVTDNFQGLQQTGVHILQEVLNVCRFGIDPLSPPVFFGLGELALFCEFLMSNRPVSSLIGLLSSRTSFMPLLVLGIMTGRDDNPTIGLEM